MDLIPNPSPEGGGNSSAKKSRDFKTDRAINIHVKVPLFQERDVG